jgi:hypothetical protein
MIQLIVHLIVSSQPRVIGMRERERKKEKERKRREGGKHLCLVSHAIVDHTVESHEREEVGVAERGAERVDLPCDVGADSEIVEEPSVTQLTPVDDRLITDEKKGIPQIVSSRLSLHTL